MAEWGGGLGRHEYADARRGQSERRADGPVCRKVPSPPLFAVKPTYVIVVALGLLWLGVTTFVLVRFILGGQFPPVW